MPSTSDYFTGKLHPSSSIFLVKESLPKDKEEFLKKVRSGILNTDELHAQINGLMGIWGTPYCDIFEEITGVPIIQCDICNLPTFVVKSSSAYNGEYDVCEACLKNYSYCQKCMTYILTLDLDNPSHKHITFSSKAFFLSDIQVNVWNADIMSVLKGKDGYFQTKDEQIIWKHQKENHFDTLHKAHHSASFRYFGVELEVEKIKGAPPDIIERTYHQFFEGFVMLKHDGSLSNKGKNGFEIVTMPATMAYHKAHAWDKFYDHLGSFFEYDPPTTGLHIHVGLNTVSRIISGKMLIFINSTKNREFVESLGERELGMMNPNGKVYAAVHDDYKISDVLKLKQHDSSCPWNPKNKASSNRYALTKDGQLKFDNFGNPIIASVKPRNILVRPTCKCQPGIYNTTKYEAFNLMTKRPTIELRFFRGIIKKAFLYSALEFTDALIDYCSIASPNQLHYRDFLAWLTQYNASGQSKLYPNLSRHLINKSWLDPNKRLTLKPGTFSDRLVGGGSVE